MKKLFGVPRFNLFWSIFRWIFVWFNILFIILYHTVYILYILPNNKTIQMYIYFATHSIVSLPTQLVYIAGVCGSFAVATWVYKMAAKD